MIELFVLLLASDSVGARGEEREEVIRERRGKNDIPHVVFLVKSCYVWKWQIVERGSIHRRNWP